MSDGESLLITESDEQTLTEELPQSDAAPQEPANEEAETSQEEQQAPQEPEVPEYTPNFKYSVRDKEFEFDIPRGIQPGQTVVLEGVGRRGINGGQPGHVGIRIAGIDKLDVNKLTSDKAETFKTLLEELENT